MTAPTVVQTNRFEWERLIRRIVMPKPVKLLALVLATYADPDGSRVRPGIPALAAVTGDSERNTKRLLGTLRKMDLIEIASRGGGRGGKGKATEYRLTIPVDLLDRFSMLHPREHGPVGMPVDNSESEDTQVSPESGSTTSNEVTSRVRSERLRGHLASNEGTQLCPPTSHRPTTNYTRPAGLRPQGDSPPRARTRRTTPTLVDSEFASAQFEAAS